MAEADNRRAGVCLYCVEEDGIYVLIGNENVYIGERHAYDIVAHGDLCSATAEFSAVLGERREPGARFAPIKKTDDGFTTIMRMNARCYGVPKGGLEKDDTPERAAVREFNEETSVFIPREYMRDALVNDNTTIFLIRVTRDNANRIIESYRTYFEPIHFGELSNLQLCRIDILPTVNRVTSNVTSRLSGIARSIPVSDISVYRAPCTGMWSSIGKTKVELFKNKIINAVADAIINHRNIRDFDTICGLRRRLSEISGRQHWQFGVVSIFLEFLELISPEEREAVRHFYRETIELIGPFIKEFTDTITKGIHRTDAEMEEALAIRISNIREALARRIVRNTNNTGGKRTKKHLRRKSKTRRNKKLIV